MAEWPECKHGHDKTAQHSREAGRLCEQGWYRRFPSPEACNVCPVLADQQRAAALEREIGEIAVCMERCAELALHADPKNSKAEIYKAVGEQLREALGPDKGQTDA